MMIHLVLDHSALIPCSYKPEDEKKAIVYLGNNLMHINATWYVSREYLKTLHGVLSRESGKCHPLPKLQRGLLRTTRQLLGLPRSKWCSHVSLPAEGHRLRIHMVGRRVSDILERCNTLLDRVPELLNLSNDDREIVALAFKASNMVNEIVYIVTIDTPLLDTIGRVLDITNKLRGRVVGKLKRLRPLTPRQLLQKINVGFTAWMRLIKELEELEKSSSKH